MPRRPRRMSASGIYHVMIRGIRELGEQLMPLGMLVTLDAIYNRVIQNWKKGRRTWIFCDEFYRARRSVT